MCRYKIYIKKESAVDKRNGSDTVAQTTKHGYQSHKLITAAQIKNPNVAQLFKLVQLTGFFETQ